MAKPLVIIHGWSDNSRSFQKLAHALEEKLQRPAKQINLADYVSMDDEVTFDDLVVAMMVAWRKHQLPETPASVDVVVHSTGGLIIRDWLVRYFTAVTAPIDHLVMLAPANFGSPLAHKGQAFYSRIVKGLKSKKPFQVGEKLLQGLELASDYGWQLAMKDRFGRENFYHAKKVLCTVLIGNKGYSGIASAANEDGSDGTVRISSANLNCNLFDVDFSENALKPEYQMISSKGSVAFGVLDGENHSTIAFKDRGPNNPKTLDYIIKGLTVLREDFPAWCQQLKESLTEMHSVMSGYQNTVFFVHDQFDFHIKDYFLEFYTKKHTTHWLTNLFYEDAIKKVHAYSQDTSYRSVYIDCSVLHQQLEKKWEQLHFSLSAFPEFKQNKNVGYRTFNDSDMGSIMIPKEEVPKIFSPHRTLMVRIKLRREQAEAIFKLKSLA